LIDFLAFLVQKLCQKNIQTFEEFPKEFAGISLINLRYFGHYFGTRNARLSIKPSKDSGYSLESNKILSHEMGWFGRLPEDDDLIQMQTKYV